MDTIETLARDLAEGRTSARELVETRLERITDPAGEGSRAFLAVHGDVARAAADFVDGLRKQGRQPSRWAGIPIAVKDLFDEAGEVTKAGSVVLADAAPADRDAVCLQRLKAAGFISLGRTNMTEFAYSGVGLNAHYGEPRAAWDRQRGRIPGGSSSGTAVAVADDMAPLALGSDTGGSCRIPAAFNGIVGYKSSTGRVPLDGVFPLSTSFDTVGPLAGSVACCATADAIMAGDWNGTIAERDPATLRFGILGSVVLDDLDTEVAAAFEAAVARLTKAGASVIDVAMASLAELPSINAGGGIVAAEAYAHHRDMIARDGERYDQRVVKRIGSGSSISAAQFIEIKRRQRQLIDEADRLSAGLDGLIFPTVAILPPPISDLENPEDYLRINLMCLRNTFIGNFLDRCAVSLPISAPGAPPVGLTIMAPHGTDQALFAAAAAAESALGGMW